jgi:hypothetical protein
LLSGGEEKFLLLPYEGRSALSGRPESFLSNLRYEFPEEEDRLSGRKELSSGGFLKDLPGPDFPELLKGLSDFLLKDFLSPVGPEDLVRLPERPPVLRLAIGLLLI